MDNTKVCIICNNIQPLTKFSGGGSTPYGRTCIDCYRNKFKDGLIICNTCDEIKPLDKFRQFTDCYGRMCHDCYSKDWKDNCMKCNKCETYKPLTSYKEFNNGFYKSTCKQCMNEIWSENAAIYRDRHRDEINQKAKEKYAKKKIEKAKLNPKPEKIDINMLNSIDVKELVHEQLTCKLLKAIAKLHNIVLWRDISRAEMINCLVKLNVLSRLALPQAKPRPPGMKLSSGSPVVEIVA